jgi:hypothetical protein
MGGMQPRVCRRLGLCRRARMRLEPSCAQAAVIRCAPVRPRPRVLTDAGVTGPLFARATLSARTLPAGLCLVALL